MILASHGIIGSSISQFTSGLLDTYTGAAAAYSLRRLSIAYTGSAIKVRRSVGSPSEKDIGFVGENLDVADLESFCSGTDGFVVTWYDQSGNGYDATQATAASQPKIVSSGSVILENGKPSVQFDGVDDWLATSVAYPTEEYQNTYYVASSSNTNNRIFDTRGTGGSVKGWQIKLSAVSSTADIDLIDDGILPILFTDGIIRGTGQNLNSSFMYGGSGSVIDSYTNGILSKNVNDAVTRDFDSGTIMVIGASRNDPKVQLINGNIQEGILYNINTSTNRTGIETNINDFYSIY